MDEVYSGVLESGAKDGINSFLIEDRFEAIKKALDMAKPGDLVVLTGKGSETSMQLSNKRIPWSEEGAVRKIMGDLK
jgi:UDP-N-acetylmuramoyl-L-alanyl-D-glutamate--2,6-diaminopimelate ligase